MLNRIGPIEPQLEGPVSQTYPPAVRYQRWLDQDARWIITDEERDAFLRLSKDEDRDQFIERFW